MNNTTILTLDPSNNGTITCDVPKDVIKGEMLLREYTVSDSEFMKIEQEQFEKDVKRKLALELAECILENKLAEFTKQYNMKEFKITFRARAFLTPDSQVRILRKEFI